MAETEIEKIELTYLENNKFKGFGEYKNEILKENENRINELMEQCKRNFQIYIIYYGFVLVIILWKSYGLK